MAERRLPLSPSAPLTRGSALGTAAAFLLAGLLLFVGLGSLPLLNPDEGRNAEVAREMSLSDNWLIPTYGGLPYLDKPALFFASVALSYRLVGVSEMAARLPSVLAALGLLFLLYRFARHEYGGRTAALAVVSVVTMPLFLVFGRAVIFDMPLALLVSGAVFVGFQAGKLSGAARRRRYFASAALSGLATLLKGPVGFVIPLLILLAFALTERRKRALRNVLFPLHALPFLAIVLPWFVATSLQYPDFPYYGLVKETAARLTTPAFERTGPLYYYVPVVFGFFFGWSLLIPGALVLVWKRRRRLERADRLLLVWSLVVVGFFSISQSKLPGYILSTVVTLGILVARLFDRAFANPGGGAARAIRQGTTALLIFCGLLVVWLGVELVRPGCWSQVFGFHGRDYARARPLFGPALASFVLVAWVAMVGVIGRSLRVAFAAFALVPICLLSLGARPLLAYAEQNSSRRLAREIREVAGNAPVALLSSHSPGLAFYLGEMTTLITDDGTETTSNYIPFSLERAESWPPLVVRRSDFAQWVDRRKEPWLLLTDRKQSAQLDSLAGHFGSACLRLTEEWSGLFLPAKVEH